MTEFEDRKSQIARILKEAAPKINHGAEGISRPTSIAFGCLVLSLMGSIIPHDGLNSLFSLSFIISGLILFHLWWKTGRRITWRSWRLALVAGVLGLQISGCSGILATFNQPDPLMLYSDIKDLKVGLAYSISYFGFEPNPATVETAMQNGGITKLHGHDRDRAFGPIRITRVKVYGI